MFGAVVGATSNPLMRNHQKPMHNPLSVIRGLYSITRMDPFASSSEIAIYDNCPLGVWRNVLGISVVGSVTKPQGSRTWSLTP